MVKFRIKELLAKKQFEEEKTITLTDVAKEAGITRNTLSRIANSRGDYNTTTDNIEKLCIYFDCTPNELMIIVPDGPAKGGASKTAPGKSETER